VKTFRKNIFAALIAFAPASLLACPACGSANPNFQSPLADGMNAGILTLMGVLVVTLASAATFFVFVIRKEAALAAKVASENFPKAKA
jgi:hypothetical protein